MRIAVAATPGLAIPTLDWLHNSEHELNLVISRPDKPTGRGRVLVDSPVSNWADAHGVTCLKPNSPEELLPSLASLDLVITIAFGVILPPKVLSVPKNGFINLHFSRLPAWRGAAPVQRAILAGDHTLGITVFALDEGLDTGPIYVQEDFEIDPRDDSGQVLEAMGVRGPDLIAKAIAMILAGSPPIAQSSEGITFAPKISKQEARISWLENSAHVDRHVRAFTPEPGAWTLWRDFAIRIDRARPISAEGDSHSGTVRNQAGHIIVACGGGTWIELEEVTPAGKKSMLASSWANGARIADGESFV